MVISYIMIESGRMITAKEALMRIRYLFGRPGVGKTDYIYREMKNVPAETRAYLLVPDQYTLRSEQDLCERSETGGLIETSVLSFSRLAYRVFSEAGGLTLTRINEQGRQMVLRRVLDSLGPDLTVFQYAAGREGFVRNISRLIGECKRFDIGAAALAGAAAGSGGLLGDKLSELARIYEAFQAFMAGRYMDGEDAVEALLSRMDRVDFLKNARIWVDGFSAFTAQHLRILRKLMELSEEITVALPMPMGASEDDLYREPARMLTKLQALAEEIDAEEVPIDMEGKAGDTRSDLSRFISGQLYAYPYEKWKGNPEDLTLWYASNRREEIEQTAARIHSLVREGKYRYRDIAVISNAEESYTEAIRRIFENYDIPVFIDARRPVRNHPLIQCVLSALESIDARFAYTPLFSYIKTGFTGLTWDEADSLENYCLRYGVQGSRWEKPFTFGEDEYILEQLNACRERVIAPLAALRETLKASPPATDAVNALREFLLSLGMETQIQDWIESMRVSQWHESVDETAQIWDMLMTVLTQMAGIMEDSPLGVAEMLRLLETGFASLEVGVIPTTLDQVAVGSVKRSLARPAKVLFVIGVNDGILPSAGADPGILSMAERSALNELGLDMPGDEEMMAARERFSIYTILSMAIEGLYVSYPLADEGGAALRPSLLIDRFRELFPDLFVRNGIIGEDTDWIATPKSALDHLIPRLREGAALPSPWRELYHWYAGEPGWRERYDLVHRGYTYENQAPPLNSEAAEGLFGQNVLTSVSRLERYAECPFAHFVRYGLRPSPRQRYEVNPVDMGSLFHDVMEAFAAGILAEDRDWATVTEEECLIEAGRIVDSLTPELMGGVFESTHRYRHLAHRIKGIAAKALWMAASQLQKGEFTPIAVEQTFGPRREDTYPPIRVTLADGRVIHLTGRIDRLDAWTDDTGTEHLRVVDYKSGPKDWALYQVLYGVNLQLMVYMNAVLSERAQGGKTARPAAALYFHIDDPIIESDGAIVEEIEKQIRRKFRMDGLIIRDASIVRAMDREPEDPTVVTARLKKDGDFYAGSHVADTGEYALVLDYVMDKAADLSERLLKGEIGIAPVRERKRVACAFCEYGSICRFDPTIAGESFRRLHPLDDSECLRRMKEARHA